MKRPRTPVAPLSPLSMYIPIPPDGVRTVPVNFVMEVSLKRFFFSFLFFLFNKLRGLAVEAECLRQKDSPCLGNSFLQIDADILEVMTRLKLRHQIQPLPQGPCRVRWRTTDTPRQTNMETRTLLPFLYFCCFDFKSVLFLSLRGTLNWYLSDLDVSFQSYQS